MHIGMLWFDNSTTLLSIKIQKAVEYYQRKYGRTPDLCLVHPSMLEENARKTTEIEFDDGKKLIIRPFRPVLPGHIWIGIEDKN